MKRRLRRPGRRGWLAIVVAGLVVVGGIGAWLSTRDGGSAAAQALTAQATSGTVKQSVSASGTIEPAKTADLDFAVSGTVTKVYVAAGAHVSKGQAIAKVDDAALVAARTAAAASYDAALTQHADDVAAGASAVQVAADQTAVLSAEAELASARRDVEDAVLRATINGTISSLDLAVGDVVSGSSSGGASGSGGSGGSVSTLSAAASTTSSSSSAVTVTSRNRFIVDATVSADDATQITQGMQAQITVTGAASTIYGTVSSVGQVAQTSSSGAAVFPVVVAVTGPQKSLYAGTSATASIIVKQLTGILTVPSRAIRSSGSSTYVLKMVGGTAVKTPVTIGSVYGASTQIRSGLSAGDTVQIPGITLPAGVRSGSGSGNRGRSGGFSGGFSGGGFPGGGSGGRNGGFGGGGQ